MESKMLSTGQLPIWLVPDTNDTPTEEALRDSKETSSEFRDAIRDKILELTERS